jgi:hypothetical protein
MSIYVKIYNYESYLGNPYPYFKTMHLPFAHPIHILSSISFPNESGDKHPPFSVIKKCKNSPLSEIISTACFAESVAIMLECLVQHTARGIKWLFGTRVFINKT